MHVTLIVLLMMSNLCHCNQYFDWLSSPGTLHRCVGDDVILTWEHNSSTPIATLFWSYGRAIGSSSAVTTFYKSRALKKDYDPFTGRTQVLDHSEQRSSLKLNNLKKSDSGNYILELAGPERAKDLAQLKVYEDADMKLQLQINNKNVSFGSDVEVEDDLDVVVLSNVYMAANVTVTPGGQVHSCDWKSECRVRHKWEEDAYNVSVDVEFAVCAPFSGQVEVRRLKGVQAFDTVPMAVVVSVIIAGILVVPLSLALAVFIIQRKDEDDRTPMEKEILENVTSIGNCKPVHKYPQNQASNEESAGLLNTEVQVKNTETKVEIENETDDAKSEIESFKDARETHSQTSEENFTDAVENIDQTRDVTINHSCHSTGPQDSMIDPKCDEETTSSGIATGDNNNSQSTMDVLKEDKCDKFGKDVLVNDSANLDKANQPLTKSEDNLKAQDNLKEMQKKEQKKKRYPLTQDTTSDAAPDENAATDDFKGSKNVDDDGEDDSKNKDCYYERKEQVEGIHTPETNENDDKDINMLNQTGNDAVVADNGEDVSSSVDPQEMIEEKEVQEQSLMKSVDSIGQIGTHGEKSGETEEEENQILATDIQDQGKDDCLGPEEPSKEKRSSSIQSQSEESLTEDSDTVEQSPSSDVDEHSPGQNVQNCDESEQLESEERMDEQTKMDTETKGSCHPSETNIQGINHDSQETNMNNPDIGDNTITTDNVEKTPHKKSTDIQGTLDDDDRKKNEHSEDDVSVSGPGEEKDMEDEQPIVQATDCDHNVKAKETSDGLRDGAVAHGLVNGGTDG